VISSPPVLGYLGVAWQVEPFARRTVAALGARLPPLELAPASATPRRRYRIESTDGGGWEARWRSGGTGPRGTFEEAVELLAQDVERLVANHAHGFLLLHAGAVVWQGRALLLPGCSHSGKSRMVAALLRAGAEYLSDEFAVLDPGGRVHPWPRRLALRRDDGGVDRPTAQELGGRTATEPAPAAGVAILQYRSGAALRLETLSPATGILGLLGHAVAARRRLPMVRANLAALSRRAAIAESARGEAEETAPALLDWLETVAVD
jgi:hypothetical protein